jgi:hypothetical protein
MGFCIYKHLYMSYDELTDEQKQNITDMAELANIATSIAQLAKRLNVSIELMMPMITGYAERKLNEL